MTLQNIAPWTAAVSVLALLSPAPVLAHCDSLDGPVVRAAQRALATGNPFDVLIWVRVDDEAEIRAAFEKTLSVRELSPQARELADRYFFETVVRVHRASEGAPYTGLKPPGGDLSPAISAADKSLEEHAVDQVVILLTTAMDERLLRHYEHVVGLTRFSRSDLSAGREYIDAYVQFIHYVERLYEAITASADDHLTELGTKPIR